MIDYNIIAKAANFYESKGYQRIEVPWTVTATIDNITKPSDRPHMQLIHNHKCLVASGEQSFLYLIAKDYLTRGKYQTVTPCWRYEDYDTMHAKCFMKNELIITDTVDNETLHSMIQTAKEFFSQFLEVEVISTDIGYDIISKDGNYELGSYGIRRFEFINWIYGTGCAEPRLSRVIETIQQNRN